MERGAIVEVALTGRQKDTGKVFDTTDEKAARENGLYKENAVFAPLPVVVGEGDVLQGLDDALLEMKVGETRVVLLEPKKAFGERNQELVRVLPLKEFRERNVQPRPGLIVNVNDYFGRVQSVSGGRVRVDFNPELAGKEVEYEVRVVKAFSTPLEKMHALVHKHFPMLKEKDVQFDSAGKTVRVYFPMNPHGHDLQHAKASAGQSILKHVKEATAVEFVERFEAQEAQKGEVSASVKKE